MKNAKKETIIVDRVEFSDALASASRCLEKRNVIPILQTFKLSISDSLTVTATDLDQSVKVEVKMKGPVDEQEVCVDGRLLTALVSRLDTDDIEMLVEPENLVIRRPSGDVKLRTRDANVYPEVPFDGDEKVAFEAIELNELCRAVLLGTVEDRIIHTSHHNVAELAVERNLIEGHFTCLSSDGHRLASVKGLCYTEQKEPFKMQIPVGAVRTLLTGLKGAKGQIGIGEDENHIFVNAGDKRLFSFRKVVVKFPDIAEYLDTIKFDRVVKVSAESLRNSLELVSQLANPNTRSVDININGSLTLSAKSADAGEIADELDIEETDFEPFEAHFSIDYILPVIRQLSGEIELRFAKDERTVTEKDGTIRTLSVTYPMRVVNDRNNVVASFDIQGRTV